MLKRLVGGVQGLGSRSSRSIYDDAFNIKIDAEKKISENKNDVVGVGPLVTEPCVRPSNINRNDQSVQANVPRQDVSVNANVPRNDQTVGSNRGRNDQSLVNNRYRNDGRFNRNPHRTGQSVGSNQSNRYRNDGRFNRNPHWTGQSVGSNQSNHYRNDQSDSRIGDRNLPNRRSNLNWTDPYAVTPPRNRYNRSVANNLVNSLLTPNSTLTSYSTHTSTSSWIEFKNNLRNKLSLMNDLQSSYYMDQLLLGVDNLIGNFNICINERY